MTSENTSFWEKWYWANFVRGTNPVTTFIKGLIWGLWIPLVFSAIFCLFTDPQWNHKEAVTGWSPVAYAEYYGYFWKSVFQGVTHYLHVYWNFATQHFGYIVRFVRHVLWLDNPEVFENIGND